MQRPLIPASLVLIAAGAIVSPLAAQSTSASAPPSAAYAELSLEQLMEVRIEKVFGASKYEQKVTRAPAAVTIVTGDEIAQFGHRTLADVLRSVRGLYVSNDGNYSYLGARGFLRPGDYNMRTLVLVDGHRMNDNLYDAAYFGRETIGAAAIDRVEVVRGPSSSIYGSSAFFGVVNIVTKRGHQLDGLELSTETGSHNTAEARASYGRRFRSGFEVAVHASYFRTDGQRRIYYPEFDQRLSANLLARHDGVAVDSDGERAAQFSANARYRDFTFSAFVSSRIKEVPTASFTSAFDTGLQETSDRRAYFDAQYQRELRPDLELSGRVFYDRYSYDGFYPYDYAAPGDPLLLVPNRDHAYGEWVGTEWQLNARLFGRHTIVSGLEFRENLHQRQLNFDDTEPRLVSIDDDRRSRTYSAFTQAEVALHDRLLLNTGLRLDAYPGSFGRTLNPRFGLIYNPAPHTTVKALYGQAFRAPNVYERFYYADLMPQALQPERIRTYELALEHYFARHHRVSVSLYRYKVTDLIEQLATVGGEFYFGNDKSVSAQGAEFELESTYASGWRTRVSYARQRTEDHTGVDLTNSPRDLAKLGLIAPLYRDQLSAGFEFQYNGPVHTLAGLGAKRFVLGNLTVTARRFVPGLELSASVYNLFDQRYGYPGAADHAQDVLPQDGRTLRLKASYRF